MTESKNSEKILRITEKMILPLAVAALVFIANNVANKIADDQLSLAKKTQEAAAAARQTEIELKYIDLFFDRILSSDPKVRNAALSLLFFINDQEAVRLAEWVAANENFDSELRESAVEISEQIQGLLPIELDTSYEHDRFGTEPRDVYRRLRAFEVSFDGPDDDDEDGTGDIWRIPHFVTSEVRSIDESDEVEDGRRSTRFRVDEELNNEGLAPADTDYRGSGYDRGHLMPHRLAGRLGSYAQQNTMSMINVAPQVPRLNRYVWNDLERKTFEWVEEYRRIWFIAGPIFYDKTPRNWINREIPIAVPDAYFKIVVKEGTKPDRPDVLAFIYPNNAELLTERNPSNYLVSVGEIEQKTKLRFFTRLPESSRNAILNQQATEIWD